MKNMISSNDVIKIGFKKVKTKYYHYFSKDNIKIEPVKRNKKIHITKTIESAKGINRSVFTLFYGKVNNISELKKILEQLEVAYE